MSLTCIHTGTAVYTAVVIGCAEWILLHEAPDLLSRVNLNKGWAQYVLQRMGFVKRKATIQGKPRSVEDFAQIKAEFLLEVEQVITMDEIPPELIINFDQTGLNVL